jgi:alpha-tubulin suppressor-like RCC1 family protein
MDVEEIYLGGWHSYAKLTDGTFYGWGYNTVCYDTQTYLYRMED